MQSNTHIILNMQAPNVAVVVNAKQGDKLSRVITADLVDGDIPFIPPSGVAAAVRYFKPDNTIGFYDVTEDGAAAIVLDGSTATVTLAEQALTVPGNVYAEINFYTSTEKLTTFNFIIHVQKSAVSDQVIESTDYFSVLTEKINAILGAAVNPPYINQENKHWMLWSETAGAYVDSGYSSIGLVPPSTVTYQAGTSGTTPPTGTWTATIPTVPQGAYLWTRTQFEFSDGTQQVSYSVARQGLDGTGSVRTVNENSPDENGNVYVMTVNPNLLDNWYFGNPVDQRGGYIAVPGRDAVDSIESVNEIIQVQEYTKATHYGGDWYSIIVNGKQYFIYKDGVVRGYTGTGYTIDRWKFSTVGNLHVTGGSIVVQLLYQYGGLCQVFEKGALPEGTYTLSLLTASGCYSWTFNANKAFPSQSSVGWFGVPDGYSYFTYNEDGSCILYIVDNASGALVEVELIAAKLELGDTQTLAHQDASGNWVLNEIPDYGEQLAKCQRYQMVYDVIANGLIWTAVASFETVARITVQLPCNLRKNPSIVFDVNSLVLNSEGVDYAISAVSLYSMAGNALTLSVTSSGLTPGKTYMLKATSATKIIFDANL